MGWNFIKEKPIGSGSANYVLLPQTKPSPCVCVCLLKYSTWENHTDLCLCDGQCSGTVMAFSEFLCQSKKLLAERWHFYTFITKELLEGGFLSPVNLEKTESRKWKTWIGNLEISTTIDSYEPNPCSVSKNTQLNQRSPFVTWSILYLQMIYQYECKNITHNNKACLS